MAASYHKPSHYICRAVCEKSPRDDDALTDQLTKDITSRVAIPPLINTMMMFI